jgi:hypothetical protein
MYKPWLRPFLMVLMLSLAGLARAQNQASSPAEASFKFTVKLADALRNSKDFCDKEAQRIVDSINTLVAGVRSQKALPLKISFVECEALGWEGADRKFNVHLQVSGRSCIHGNPAVFPLKHEYRLRDWSSYSAFTRDNDSAALDSLGIRFIMLKDQSQLLLLPDCGRVDD